MRFGACARPGKVRALLAALACAGPLRANEEDTGAPRSSVPPARDELVRPVPRHTPAPDYPEGAEGDAVVVLELTVATDGSVVDPRARSGDEPFIGAALETVAGWRFEPARLRGKQVSTRLLFELRFYEPTFEDDDPIVTESFQGKPPVAARTHRAAPVTEVIVRGDLPDAPKTSFSRAEVRELPGAFGDPFRAIEVMPGVTPLATGIPYFFVRGAPPGNVGYFIDGVRVPLLYHLGLGPSVIHPGSVDSVDLYASAYPVRYGGAAGAVVAAETLPARSEWHAEANLRLFDAGALVEAPLPDDKGSVLVAGRYSYAEPLLQLFAPELSLNYWDYQVRSSYALDSKNTLSVFAFGSLDSFESTDGGFGAFGESQFHRVDLRADRVLGERTHLRVAVTLGLDRTRSDFEIPNIVTAVERQLGVRAELDHALADTARLRAGVDTTLARLEAELAPDVSDTGDAGEPELDVGLDDRRLDVPSRTELTAGLWADVVLTPHRGISVTPGLRLDLYHVRPSRFLLGGPDQITSFGVDPRISARFDVSERVSIENAFGIAHQPASFTLPIPGYEITDARGGLQKSLQSSAAVEWRPGREWTLKLTLFQNAYFDMTDTLTLGQYDDDEVPAVSYVDRTLGHSYGAEFMIRRPLARRVGGYLAYTLSRSERSAGRFDGPAAFDHTHVAHAALAVDLGSGFRFGSRLTFYTGIPAIRLAGDALGELGLGDPAEWISPVSPGPYPEPRRAPSFVRLDLRFEKRFLLGDAGAWLSVVVETLNTTLSREILEYRCDRRRCETDKYGPIAIPSAGLEASL